MANEIEAYTNFLFYNSEDGKTSIQVIADADAETIWTTQKGMAQIFGVEVPAISKHLKNIFDSRELDEKAVVSKMEITADTRISPPQPELMNDITLIQNKIYEIRGQRVMLDFDLAPLYQVQTKVLKQAVRRNIERFPADFMFEITIDEYNSLKDSLRSQIVTSNKGGTRYMPFAFTEQGVSMLSSVLRSDAAIQVNIAVMRAFVAMRNYITTTTTLTAELSEIRAKLALLERTDEDNAEAINDLSEDMRKELDNIYQAIAALSVKTPQARKQPRLIGYKTPEK